MLMFKLIDVIDCIWRNSNFVTKYISADPGDESKRSSLRGNFDADITEGEISVEWRHIVTDII